MYQIGEIVGGDVYIRPSSCRDAIVVLKTVDIELKVLFAKEHQINWTEVRRKTRLSSYIQHYDCKVAVMDNTKKQVLFENVKQEKTRQKEYL